MPETQQLTVENHLQRDSRLDVLSVAGLGPYTHTTDQWVGMILSIELDTLLPSELREIYSRAQAAMVYGCYHYPLFTLGCEELYRFQESSLRAAVGETGATARVLKMKYAVLVDWAKDAGFMDARMADRWHAGRWLRNSTSHKTKNMLLGPNDALQHLSVTKELTEALFDACRTLDRQT